MFFTALIILWSDSHVLVCYVHMVNLYDSRLLYLSGLCFSNTWSSVGFFSWLQHDVAMHSFDNGNSTKTKDDNWAQVDC